MKESIRFKLESVRDRFEEIAGLLADPDVIADQNQFRDLSKEYSRVEPVVQSFQRYEGILDDIVAAEEMAQDADADVREMGQEELAGMQERREALLAQIGREALGVGAGPGRRAEAGHGHRDQVAAGLPDQVERGFADFAARCFA